MLLLVNPLAVALEVDLRGRSGLAVQVDRLVLDYVGLLRLHQEHRQGLGRVRGEGLWQLPKTDEVIIHCEETEKDGGQIRDSRERLGDEREEEGSEKNDWVEGEMKADRRQRDSVLWDYPLL